MLSGKIGSASNWLLPHDLGHKLWVPERLCTQIHLPLISVNRVGLKSSLPSTHDPRRSVTAVIIKLA